MLDNLTNHTIYNQLSFVTDGEQVNLDLANNQEALNSLQSLYPNLTPDITATEYGDLVVKLIEIITDHDLFFLGITDGIIRFIK